MDGKKSGLGLRKTVLGNYPWCVSRFSMAAVNVHHILWTAPKGRVHHHCKVPTARRQRRPGQRPSEYGLGIQGVCIRGGTVREVERVYPGASDREEGRNTYQGLQDRTGREQSKASKQQTRHEGNGRGLPVDEPEATMTDTHFLADDC